MSLFTRGGFEAFVTGLPATTLVEQWGASVAKVGGKVFALIGLDAGAIDFKCSEMSFDLLTEIEGIGQAPYFAKRQWVAVSRHADLPEEDLMAYVRESHRIIASKLTRKARAELGLDALVAAGPRGQSSAQRGRTA